MKQSHTFQIGSKVKMPLYKVLVFASLVISIEGFILKSRNPSGQKCSEPSYQYGNGYMVTTICCYENTSENCHQRFKMLPKCNPHHYILYGKCMKIPMLVKDNPYGRLEEKGQ